MLTKVVYDAEGFPQEGGASTRSASSAPPAGEKTPAGEKKHLQVLFM